MSMKDIVKVELRKLTVVGTNWNGRGRS